MTTHETLHSAPCTTDVPRSLRVLESSGFVLVMVLLGFVVAGVAFLWGGDAMAAVGLPNESARPLAYFIAVGTYVTLVFVALRMQVRARAAHLNPVLSALGFDGVYGPGLRHYEASHRGRPVRLTLDSGGRYRPKCLLLEIGMASVPSMHAVVSRETIDVPPDLASAGSFGPEQRPRKLFCADATMAGTVLADSQAQDLLLKLTDVRVGSAVIVKARDGWASLYLRHPPLWIVDRKQMETWLDELAELAERLEAT